MDIIVRVPKDQIGHFWEEPPADAAYEYWRLPSKPSKTTGASDDRIWFVIDGQIVAAASILGFWDDPEIRVFWSVSEFKKLDAPVKAEKVPFRGYLYMPIPPDSVTYWCGWNVPEGIPKSSIVRKWPEGMKGWESGIGDGYTTWVARIEAPTPARAEAMIRSCYHKGSERIEMRWEPKAQERDWWPPGGRFPR